MQKPLVVLRQEFVSDAVTLVNKYSESGVPMFVMLDVLNDLNKNVQAKAQEQYNYAKQMYDEAEAKEAEEKEESEVVEEDSANEEN